MTSLEMNEVPFAPLLQEKVRLLCFDGSVVSLKLREVLLSLDRVQHRGDGTLLHHLLLVVVVLRLPC